MECNLDWRREVSALWPEVAYQIRPLKVWAFQELLAFWEAHGGTSSPEGGGGRVSPADGLKLMTLVGPIFAEHVRELSGLTLVREGQPQPATTDALCEETALMPLAGEIVSRLMAISEVSPTTEKN